MLIDWVTVIAQIVNFLILVYLLKRFLYGPIVRAMKNREERIRTEVEEAEKARREAEKKEALLRQREEDLQAEEVQMREEAAKAVEEWKEQKLNDARREYEQEKTKWSRRLAEEQDRDRNAVRDAMMRQVFRLTGKLLAELGDRSMEEQVLRKFKEELSRQEQGGSVQTGGMAFSIRLTHGPHLDEEQQKSFAAWLKELFPGADEVTFTRDVALSIGFVLEVGGWQWRWNALDGLRKMEDEAFRDLGTVGCGGGV